VYKAEKKEGAGVAQVLTFVHLKSTEPEKECREIHVLHNVRHPNIVRLMGVYSASRSDNLAFVLAFPEADTDLHSMLARREGRRIGSPLLQHIAMQLAEGLRALHDMEVMHRDFKPANILIYLDQDPMRVAIAGLTRAKRVPHRRVKGKWTAALRVTPLTPGLGTAVYYNAPELLIKPGEAPCELIYGCSADVWSYGCVVYEMLQGVPLVHCVRQDHYAVAAAIIARIGAPPKQAAAQPWVVSCEPMVGVGSLAEELSSSDYWFVREALCWAPQERTTMRGLIGNAWFIGHKRRADALELNSKRSTPARTSSSASATSPGVTSVDEESSWFVPLPPLEYTTSGQVCACSRRCTNAGHSRNSSTPCQCYVLVKGSKLCSICVCSLKPYCLKPRHNSIRCYAHNSLFESLSWPMQAAHLLGEQGQLIRCFCMSEFSV